ALLRQWETQRRGLLEELERLRANQAAFRVGPRLASALYRLNRPFGAPRPRTPEGQPGQTVANGAAPAPSGPGNSKPEFRKPMKTVAEGWIRPFYRVAKRLGRPLAWRLRVFLIQPILAELHAIPALGAQLRQDRDELAQGLTDIRILVQQLEQLLCQMREH